MFLIGTMQGNIMAVQKFTRVECLYCHKRFLVMTKRADGAMRREAKCPVCKGITPWGMAVLPKRFQKDLIEGGGPAKPFGFGLHRLKGGHKQRVAEGWRVIR